MLQQQLQQQRYQLRWLRDIANRDGCGCGSNLCCGCHRRSNGRGLVGGGSTVTPVFGLHNVRIVTQAGSNDQWACVQHWIWRTISSARWGFLPGASLIHTWDYEGEWSEGPVACKLGCTYFIVLFFNRPLQNFCGHPDAAPAAGQNSPGQKKCTGTLSMCVI